MAAAGPTHPEGGTLVVGVRAPASPLVSMRSGIPGHYRFAREGADVTARNLGEMLFAAVEFSTVVAAAGAAGLGGLLSAAFGVRTRRHEQTRERMLVAADEFAVAAAEVFVHLRHVKPPWNAEHRNLALIGRRDEIDGREVALNQQLDLSRRLSGRVRLLFGPESIAAGERWRPQTKPWSSRLGE